ncbi:testicular acid phosphatase homolog [Diabrotica undecimpunctata]|uniref:testicular acid phosphatase homolog n=1 Tax=Diabrotica undecimpunctata TaxID=50387 RepID=UPI003B6349B9
MRKIAVLLLVLFQLCLGKSVENDGDQLVGVAVCYRHGDRAPVASFPNDPYVDAKYWPDGIGELVNKGKVHQFQLGQWLRRRYKNFLSSRYYPTELFVRSTDVDRTLNSAASNLAGLYYPDESPDPVEWPQDLPWNPVPIHTVSYSDDSVLAMKKKCENFDKLYKETVDSEYFKNVMKNHTQLKEFVDSKTGWNTTLDLFRNLWTVLYIYNETNSSYVPDWANEINQEELAELAGLSFSTETFTPSLQRFKVGPFFNYLNDYFDGILNGTNPKFLMLSAHDGTIASILNTFGDYNYKPPQFCSTIIWELYRSSAGEPYLNIYFKDGFKTESVVGVKIGNCVSACRYDFYKKVLINISVDKDSWENECNADKSA